MPSETDNSKEVIKNRMLRHALTYWGIKNTEDLDPVVKLILEALSLELYNAGNEIKDTQVRILEKIAGLLTPDFLTTPHPAHAILHAAPVEPTESLPASTGFFAQARLSSGQNGEPVTAADIYFTPVDSVQLFDVQVAYTATGGTLYAVDQAHNKQLLARSTQRFTEANTLWLGLNVHPAIEHLQNLSFYFDWKNLEARLAQRIYQLLPLTKWLIADQEIETVQGIQYVPEERKGYESIFSPYDMLSIMENDIKSYYGQKFVSIAGRTSYQADEWKQPYPPSFKMHYAAGDLQKLRENLLWIKIVFPAAVQPDFLESVYVYTNAFPVMNRQVNELKYRLKGGNNIIPLKTAAFDQFLSVKLLSDEMQSYKAVPYRQMEEEESGTYTLRNGGVERFDNRNARELVSYLLELMRSESAAFAAYGYDFIAATLKEMNQKIALMESRTKGFLHSAAEMPNYIIVKPLPGRDMMYATYWTTLAEAANNLRAGTRMQQSRGVKVKQDSIQLLTTTIGGKSKLRPEERLHAFRYGIMTRNRIITREDIRSFCLYELGERISKVEVERGFELLPHRKEAFRRTIDVILTPAETDTLEKETWELLGEQLKSKLQTRSGMSNHYRIIIKHLMP